MKVLFDENIDYRLKFSLPSIEVFTVPEMEWSGLKNGELLTQLIEADFSHFITADQSIRYQQNEKRLIENRISVIILKGRNKLAVHLSHIRAIVNAINKKGQGGFIEVRYN